MKPVLSAFDAAFVVVIIITMLWRALAIAAFSLP